MERGQVWRVVRPSVVVLGLVLTMLPAAAGSSEEVPAWLDALWAEPTSGFTGADEVRDGTYVYTDHVFDDRGANVSGGAGGDFQYPQTGPPYMRNAADLVEIRVRPDDDVLSVGVRINTLLDTDVPIVALGIVDAGTAEAKPWPFGAGVRADGVRWVVTLRGAEAVVSDLSAATETTLALDVHNDTPLERRHLENTLSLRLPLATLGMDELPDELALHAVSGVRDGDHWHRPAGDDAPAPYDLAFVPDEEFANWQQNRQADLLASGDITEARGRIDFTSFPERPASIPTGAHTRIYRSSIEMQMGEGIRPYTQRLVTALGDTGPPVDNVYLGLFLPYAVWVPPSFDDLPKPLPVFLKLHGLTQNHQSLMEYWIDGRIDVPAIAVSPLGRGEALYYQGASILDVFEALEDAKRHYPVDADRVFVSGLSMGGIGTYNAATQRPDLFAGAVPIVGPGSGWRDFLWPAPLEPVMGPARDHVELYRMGSFGREALENALHVPFRIFAGARDTLTLITFSEGDVARFEELGYDYQYALFLNRGHELIPEYVNAVYHQLLHGCTDPDDVPGCDPALADGGLVRDPDPARVVYKAVPFHWYPDLGIVFDGAYWVSGLELREQPANDSFGLVDATSLALADEQRSPAETLGPDVRFFEPTGDHYRFQGRRWAVDPQEPQNGFTVSLENLAAATLDLDRMGIDHTDFEAMIKGDGHTDLTLLGPFAAGQDVTVLRDGEPYTDVTVTDGALVLHATFGSPSVFTVAAG